jgi:hypothetical protein
MPQEVKWAPTPPASLQYSFILNQLVSWVAVSTDQLKFFGTTSAEDRLTSELSSSIAELAGFKVRQMPPGDE